MTAVTSPVPASDLTLETPLDPAAFAETGDVVALALGFPREAWDAYVATVIGAANVRALRIGGRVAGGLARMMGGLWFGGRSVPAAGIAAVGVAVEHRGRGVAARLMSESLREAAAQGVPLSVLHASSLRVYRKVGYEPAGARHVYAIATEHLPVLDRDLPVEKVPVLAPAVGPHGPASLAPFQAVDRALALRAAGRIDRSEAFWARLFRARGDAVHAYVAGPPGAPEGYAIWTQPASDTPPLYDVDVRELACATPRALRRLVTLLADTRSFAREVRWPGPAREPLLALLPEERARASRIACWLLRIVLVKEALEARGYAPGPAREVHLEVTDALLPANQRRIVLRVEGGRGRVEAGGTGALRLDVRALAPLYTGRLDGRALALLGMCEGTEEALDAATAIFAGPEPWLPDMF